MAKALKKKGVKTFYFICPQVWAWRQGRVKTIRKYIDKVAAIFPFEEPFYKKNNVDVTFIGHPYVDRDEIKTSKTNFFADYELDLNKRLLALLPGSRKSEINFLLPVMISAYKLLKKDYPDLQAAIPLARTVDRSWFENVYKEVIKDEKLEIKLIDGQAREILNFSDTAIIASGTATMEAALAHVPFVSVYKLTSITYLIGKLLIRGVSNYAMPNLIADKEVIKEFIQHEATSENIYTEIKKLLSNKDYYSAVSAELKKVDEKLSSKNINGGPSSSRRGAEIAFNLLESKRDE